MADNNFLSSLLNYGQSFAQGASNSIAGNVSAPIDGMAWLLRRAGVPMPSNPVGGSDWMNQQGLTPQPQVPLAGMLGEAAGMAGPMVAAAKAPQIAGGLLRMGENAMVPRTMNPQTGAVVWHGSPHKFDAFDSSKIGTGEGAQAYGHGLYLADSQGVADTYKKVFQSIDGGVMVDGAAITPKNFSVSQMVSDNHKNPKELSFALRDYIKKNAANPYAGADDAKSILDSLNAGKTISPILKNDGNGQLYKVDLPDEHIAKMLDWDSPLSKQAPEVQAAVRKIRPGIDNYGSPVNGKMRGAMEQSGEDFVEWMGRGHADRLQQQGIPGIRYLDGGSRATGGTSNYVVFPGNESMLNILERNGVPLKSLLNK